MQPSAATAATLFDETDLEIVRAATELARFGVHGRNLRVFRTSADREAALLEQILGPSLRSRSPARRKEAVESLEGLAATCTPAQAPAARPRPAPAARPSGPSEPGSRDRCRPCSARDRRPSADRVWELVADPHNLPRWWPETVRVEDVAGIARRASAAASRRSSRRARDAASAPTSAAPARPPASGSSGSRRSTARRSRASCAAPMLELRLDAEERIGSRVTLEAPSALRGLSRLGAPMMRGRDRAPLDDGARRDRDALCRRPRRSADVSAGDCAATAPGGAGASRRSAARARARRRCAMLRGELGDGEPAAGGRARRRRASRRRGRSRRRDRRGRGRGGRQHRRSRTASATPPASSYPDLVRLRSRQRSTPRPTRCWPGRRRGGRGDPRGLRRRERRRRPVRRRHQRRRRRRAAARRARARSSRSTCARCGTSRSTSAR